jgi:hypothetical protein
MNRPESNNIRGGLAEIRVKALFRDQARRLNDQKRPIVAQVFTDAIDYFQNKMQQRYAKKQRG